MPDTAAPVDPLSDEDALTALVEAIDAVPHPLCIYDPDDRLLACSARFRQLHAPAFEGLGSDIRGAGLHFEDVLRKTYERKYPPRQAAARVQAELGRHRRGEYYKDINSEGRWFRRTKNVTENGLVVGLSVSIDELIRKTEALEEAKFKLEHQAFHDPLTDLPNRRALQAHLKATFGVKGSTLDEVAVFHVDLDKFKAVNDTLGHDAGDHVLTQASDILRTEVRSDDFVARIGGDEFVLVCHKIGSEENASRIAQRIVDRMKEPIYYGDEMCQIGASIGIAMCSDVADINRILMDADIALYEAKRNGRSCFEYFYPRHRDRYTQLQRQVHAVREALMLNAFEPFYQPQVCMTTGKLLGMEALARWRDREKGVLGPGHFMAALEDARLVDELDAMILRKALKDLNSWDEEGVHVPVVSVNLSSSRLSGRNAVDMIKWAVDDAGVDPDRVCLEILEHVLVDDAQDQIARNVKQLADAGFHIALDDFGTGRASISGLRHLSLERIKIDRSFVSGINDDDELCMITSAMIALGKNLGMEVLCEGVETPEEIATVRDLGCDAIQGYAIAKPMASDMVPVWVSSGDLEETDLQLSA